MISSKSKLAIVLSQLKKFINPDVTKEQYSTESEIAAEIIWFAAMNGDLKGKIVADLGCGTGILGIGCLLMGAKRVYFVDSDSDALKIAKDNVSALRLKNAFYVNAEVVRFNRTVHTIVENPPFGVKYLHADRVFLEKAFELADTIYSFHKLETRPFIENFAKINNFKPTHFFKCGYFYRFRCHILALSTRCFTLFT